MTDLPPGKWTPYLIGAWWPAAPLAPTEAAAQWGEQQSGKEAESEGLRLLREQLGQNNSGNTAEDILRRMATGGEYLLDIAGHCEAKSTASRNVAQAVETLRTELRTIASTGNADLDKIWSEAGSPATKIPRMNATISAANLEAIDKTRTATQTIVQETQTMFDKLGVGVKAEDWLTTHGARLESPPKNPSLSDETMTETASQGGLGSDGGAGAPGRPSDGKSGSESRGSNGNNVGENNTSNGRNNGSSGGQQSASSGGGGNAKGEQPVVMDQSGSVGAHDGAAGTRFSKSSGPAIAPTENPVPTAPSNPPPSLSTSAPNLSGGAGGGMPSLGGGGLDSPTSSLPSMPLSGTGAPAAGMPSAPSSDMGQAFMSGLTQPNAAGPAALGSNLNPSTFSTGPQVPPSPAVTPMAGAGMTGPVGPIMSGEVVAAPVAPAAPPPVPGGSVGPAPVLAGGTPTPGGPLPAYGADLRPPVVTPPTAGPIPGAPAIGSPASTPAAGHTVTSQVERSGQTAAPAGTAKHSPGSPVGMAGAAATAGAAAGQAARGQAERSDLQRKVEFVARQAPMLAWAAGLRDDETTTAVVTDLAGGWIPPTVALPPGVSLLPPTPRRRDLSVEDLLGPVVAAAVHHRHGYLPEPSPDEPVRGSGERARHGHRIDELGPALTDAALSCPGLPRIAQTVARALARRTGVDDNEITAFQQVITDSQTRVLSAYPQHNFGAVAEWMLLAAIDALIDGREETARYHLAWYRAVAVRQGGLTS